MANQPPRIEVPSITQHMSLFSSSPVAAVESRHSRSSLVSPLQPPSFNQGRIDTDIADSTNGVAIAAAANNQEHEATTAAVPSTFHPSDEMYDHLMTETSAWVRDLESIRDKMRLWQVKNAILLDNLAMVGADAGRSIHYQQQQRRRRPRPLKRTPES